MKEPSEKVEASMKFNIWRYKCIFCKNEKVPVTRPSWLSITARVLFTAQLNFVKKFLKYVSDWFLYIPKWVIFIFVYIYLDRKLLSRHLGSNTLLNWKSVQGMIEALEKKLQAELRNKIYASEERMKVAQKEMMAEVEGRLMVAQDEPLIDLKRRVNSLEEQMMFVNCLLVENSDMESKAILSSIIDTSDQDASTSSSP